MELQPHACPPGLGPRAPPLPEAEPRSSFPARGRGPTGELASALNLTVPSPASVRRESIGLFWLRFRRHREQGQTIDRTISVCHNGGTAADLRLRDDGRVRRKLYATVLDTGESREPRCRRPVSPNPSRRRRSNASLVVASSRCLHHGSLPIRRRWKRTPADNKVSCSSTALSRKSRVNTYVQKARLVRVATKRTWLPLCRLAAHYHDVHRAAAARFWRCRPSNISIPVRGPGISSYARSTCKIRTDHCRAKDRRARC